MRINRLPLAATLAVSTALFLGGGCKSSAPPANNETAASPAVPASAPAGQPASEPAPGVAAAPAPAAVAPAPAPAPAPPAETAPPPPPPAVKLTAPSGATVTVTVTQQLSAKANKVGDAFTGELAAPVTTSGGATVFPRGAHVLGTVTASKGQGKFKGEGTLAIAVTEISGHKVTTNDYLKEEKGKGKRSTGMIAGGAGGGALIGGLAGGGKGAAIGAVVGAGAGTAGAALTGNKDVVIPAESVVTFHLTAPVTVTK